MHGVRDRLQFAGRYSTPFTPFPCCLQGEDDRVLWQLHTRGVYLPSLRSFPVAPTVLLVLARGLTPVTSSVRP